jgi:transcriptional regulator with XRE-family HTH domain
VSIGERVRTGRKALHLSQEEVARRAGVSLNQVNRLERGEIVDPHFSTLAGLATALDMQISELVGELTVPLAEAPETGHDMRVSEWLREEYGHTSEEEFLAWASDLDLDLDEKGFPHGIERATHELKRRRDRILDALRDPDVQADLFGRAQTEGLTGDDWAREVFRPSKAAWKLANEIRQEYTRREVSLVNYSVRLFVEGATNDYLAYDRSREYLERRHRELLKLRTRALEEGSNKTHTKREMHHWLDEAYGGAA